MANEYDITEAFAAIERELINSMFRNIKSHKAEEIKEDKQWTQWQVEQLKALEQYKVQNQKKYSKKFRSINNAMEEMIRLCNEYGGLDQEKEIAEAIKNGFKGFKKASKSMQGEFFKLNERKLDALIKATMKDAEKAERAILRMANDKYRSIIFNAQVYANTGAGTYEQAIDMASKDFLSAGLNCVEYKNGARHKLSDYISMALRTANKRAYLYGEGEKRQEWGISTVIMNKRGNPCPLCLPWVGKVLIDDVWSGGSAKDGPYPLLSTAMAAGLYHPNCRDSHTTYFEGISTPPDDKFTKQELEEIEANYQKMQKRQYAKRQAEKYERLAENSLDEENKTEYFRKSKLWGNIRDRIDILFEHKPLKISELKEEHRDAIVGILGNSDERIKKVTLKYLDEIRFSNVSAKRGAITSRGIRVDLKNAPTDKRGAYTSVFHEMGHAVDRASGRISRKPEFTKAIKNDFTNVVNGYQLYYNVNVDEAYRQIGDRLKGDDMHAISDIVGGITKNKCVGTYRHKKEYWETPHSLEQEAFAHFYEAYARNDGVKIDLLNQMFPQASKVFLDLLEGI